MSDLSPNKLHNRAILLSVALFVLLVVGMFVFVILQRTETVQNPTNNNEFVDKNDKYSDITRIDAKHFYIDGTHTVAGEIQMPTPCDLVEVSALVAESYPEQVTLDFKVINNAETCAMVVTSQRFMVSVEGSESATFKALFNNRVVELNLIEAMPGERPEDFELFIKG